MTILDSVTPYMYVLTVGKLIGNHHEEVDCYWYLKYA